MEGLAVEMVIVADDVAVDGGVAGRRGLAGTIFVHKVAWTLDSCDDTCLVFTAGVSCACWGSTRTEPLDSKSRLHGCVTLQSCTCPGNVHMGFCT